MSERLDAGKSSRRIYIECLRIVACFFVIVNHTNSQIFLAGPTTVTGVTSLAYFFVCKVAVTVFLFIMGAVLLGRQDSPAKSAMRIVRIIEVIVLFSIPYYIYQHHLGLRELHPAEFVRLLITKHMTVAHWYLYAYLGLLCILPLMQKMSIHFSRGDIRLLVALSLGINGTLPLLSTFLDINVSGHIGNNFFGSNIAIVFAGYYLDRYVTMDRKKFLGACVGFVALVTFQVAATLKLYAWNPGDYLQLDNYSGILIVMEAACVFCMAKYLLADEKTHKGEYRWIKRISGLTFGIYLLADLLIDLSRPFYLRMSGYGYINPIVVVIIWELMIFAAGGVITFGLKKLPVFRKLL